MQPAEAEKFKNICMTSCVIFDVLKGGRKSNRKIDSVIVIKQLNCRKYSFWFLLLNFTSFFSLLLCGKLTEKGSQRKRCQMHKHNIKIMKKLEILQAKFEVIIELVSKAFREHSATSCIKYTFKSFIICYHSCCRFCSVSRTVFIQRKQWLLSTIATKYCNQRLGINGNQLETVLSCLQLIINPRSLSEWSFYN